MPVLIVIIAAAILLSAVGGCGAPKPSAPAGYAGEFAGGYDETIGPKGPAAAGFSDAEFVQLLLPDDIPPIYAPRFVPAADADLPHDELVIGLSINGDVRAYPTGILFSRELVNDVVGGVPVLVSWCPRCYAALVHERRVNGTAAVFGNQGALYKGAMTWFDHGTGSIWSQPLGMALTGPEAGATLRLVPSQLTTWSKWAASHPETTALVVSEPSPAFRGNRPGVNHVVGVVVGDSAAAWPYESVIAGEVDGVVGDTPVAVWRDAETGAIRARTTGDGGRELPTLIAYRSAWLKFYPGSIANHSD